MTLTADDLNAIRDLIRDETASLRAELDRVDDWANGVFLALEDALLPLLKAQPDLAERIAPVWQAAAERYDQQDPDPQEEQTDDWAQPREQLEARKILYRCFAQMGVWPGVDAAQARQQTLARARATRYET